mgnify:CR=1 FL=1
MSHKSIEKRKKDFERCSLNMQFYCLDPDPKKYAEICNFTRIKMDIGESFNVWKKCVDGEYNDIREQILSKLTTNPTPSVVDCVWYMFFATGDTNLLISLYEVCGHESISKRNSEMFMDMYIQFTLEYKKRIDKIKESSNNMEPHIEKIIKGFAIVDKIIEQYENKKANSIENHIAKYNRE